ncbi:S-layer family protein [Alkalinema sp. FACHB-956]|uniref:two-partner secretion domain-containing protein n=1 Tax=Alkalinema sp. FACHB-956 TaxID=2692768 RepID=UPI0016843741|nr:S-layer family protein [Alkalinema sp. FACHB-956]MBD2328077.1 S-layer family protein [Alkalinema sp. FACHB-956]
MHSQLTYGLSLAIGLMMLGAPPILAQVVPDGSLSTTVTSSGNNFTINQGNLAGSNLFHSFSGFSVPTGGSAFFNNALTVQNIFARVTGGAASNIDGLLKANGTANLFLLNPSGILFGPNATLNLGGSLFSTTANSVQFADGTTFIATNPSSSSLLTMSAPIGLQMGQTSAAITVNGSQLRLPSRKTMAFLGNGVTLTKSRLTVVDGHVAIGSVAPGNNLGLSGNPFQLNYRDVNQFSNITLNNSTTINTSGTYGGPIILQGKAITLSQGSILASHTAGAISGQGIYLKGSESIDLQGVPTSSANTAIAAHSQVNATAQGGDVTLEAPYFRMTNGAVVDLRAIGAGDSGNIIVKASKVDIVGEALHPVTKQRVSISTLASNTVLGSSGRGGDITIEATEVNLRDGAELRASARGKGNGGNIRITADQLNVTGETATGEPAFLTGITTSNREYATGRGGDITLNVRKIAVLNGPGIRTGTYGEGDSGNIFVNADEVTIAGSSSTGVSSRFFSSTNGNYNFNTQQLISLGKGSGGDITFNVNTLNLLDGGRISTSTETYGQSGKLAIQAQSVNIAGVSRSPAESLLYSLDATGPSGLSASSTGPGNAGSVYVSTQSLNLSDRGEITVTGQGLGDAGNILIQANAIRLNQAAKLRAEATSGSQGNIDIRANTLLLRQGSVITANATQTANGGNLSFNVPIIVGWENSDVIANANKGRGGNINITTQGIFGLRYRDRLTPENDITASSEFGVNGTVQVNTIGTDPNAGLTELPVNVTDPSQKIATGCDANQGSQFVATGRGGIPKNPNQQVVYDHTWNDLRDISTYRSRPAIVAQVPATPQPLVQASGFQRKDDGSIELVASPASVPAASIATCAG